MRKLNGIKYRFCTELLEIFKSKNLKNEKDYFNYRGTTFN